MENGLFLELHGEEDSDDTLFICELETNSVLCGCKVSINERPESIQGFCDAIPKQSAYILSNKIISFPTENGLGYNVLLIERNEKYPGINEAWVYLTACVTAIQNTLSSQPTPWLLLNESPIGTRSRSGRRASLVARLLSDEKSHYPGQTALHIAAETGDETTLRQLLQTNEYDIEARDKRRWTPLHTASFHGHSSCARRLLSHGAEADAEDSHQRSPLILAADEGHTSTCKVLIQSGADPNFSQYNARSPLNQAISRSHVDTVKVLLENGADPTLKDKWGWAPLFSAHSKSVEIIELLISAGADPMQDLVGGATCLHFAARSGNIAVSERLLALGVPVDLPEGGGDGITALYRAVEEQCEEVVRLLLERGADVNRVVELKEGG